MDPINKKTLSERDICTKYITPAIYQAGWDIHTQVTFTNGDRTGTSGESWKAQAGRL
jgi:type I site-specific restriction endonuclease